MKVICLKTKKRKPYQSPLRYKSAKGDNNKEQIKNYNSKINNNEKFKRRPSKEV